jgi:hypothetical protein
MKNRGDAEKARCHVDNHNRNNRLVPSHFNSLPSIRESECTRSKGVKREAKIGDSKELP